jgi:methanogenic corrinoid protein MtbC1
MTENKASSSRPNTYRRYWLSLYRRDVAQARSIVETLRQTWTPWRIYLQLFAPALELSGAEWAAGNISHRDEHFVTYHTLRFMRPVRHKLIRTPPAGPRALATGVGTDAHRIGLQMVCDFLNAANWRTRALRTNERGTLRDAIAADQPQALLFSIRYDRDLPEAHRLVADARRSGFQGPIAIGGAAIESDPTRLQHLGGDLTAPHGLDLARKLKPLFPDTNLSAFRTREAK